MQNITETLPSVKTVDIETPKGAFIVEQCMTTGLGIVDLLYHEKCSINKDSVHFIASKKELKSALNEGKQILMFLNISQVQLESGGCICKGDTNKKKLVPFILVGYDDYKYVAVLNQLGATRRHRGYFTVVPAYLDNIEMNRRFIPYKCFDVGEENTEDHLVTEVWSVNDIETDIFERIKPTIKLKIDDYYMEDEGLQIKIDAPLYYSTTGNPQIPLRAVAEQLGYDVKWKRFSKTIIITKGTRKITAKIGSETCYIGDLPYSITYPVHINREYKHAYVSLGFIKHIFGLDASFCKETQTIQIIKNSTNK